MQCVIVDDHTLLLDLLVGAVGGMPGLEVTATGTDVVDAERLAALEWVDLLIVDRQLNTGDGMDIVRRIRDRHPGMKCIVIAGTTGDFVCPTDLLDVVVSVINKTQASDTLLAEIARVVDLPEAATGKPVELVEIRGRLTVREWQLFVALGDGLSNKELGVRLGISTRTVETHRKAIARKLGVSGAALVRLAVLQRQAGESASSPQDQPATIP